MSASLRSLVFVGCMCGALGAQDAAALETGFAASTSKLVLAFAQKAERDKVLPIAKQAYDLVLEYDPETRAARLALGFVKLQGVWQPPAPDQTPRWFDKSTKVNRDKTTAAWTALKKQLAGLHRDHALRLVELGAADAAKRHFTRTLEFDPDDAQAHKGLGHEERKGFFGTPEQIAFLERLHAIELGAAKIAGTQYPAEALPGEALPPELQKAGLAFTGAKSKRFTFWTRGTQAQTAECAAFAERALDLVLFLVGDEGAAQLGVSKRAPTAWVAFTFDQPERDQILTANPEPWQGQDLSAISVFNDFVWPSRQGKAAIVWSIEPHLHDRVVGLVVYESLLYGRNAGLGEGLLHVATSLLVGSTKTWYGALPATVSQSDKLLLPVPDEWLARLRGELAAGTAIPLVQLPRERRTSFRPLVRVESWSFMLWLCARHEHEWLPFFLALPGDKPVLPEDVEAAAKQHLHRDIADVEQEWRDWALGESELAKASGHGADK